MIGPRSEEIAPGLVQVRAIGAIDHVLREELVAALVLDLEYERVVLRAVVGIVERRRHGVLVGGIGLAVRVRRQRCHVLGHVGAERPVARALAIGEEHALERVARRAFRPIGKHHAHDGVAVFAELRVGLELEDVAAGRNLDRERRRSSNREVVSIRACCHRDWCQTPESWRRPERRASGAAASITLVRLREHRPVAAVRRLRRWSRAAACGSGAAGHDARVAPDDDGSGAVPGSDVGKGDVDLLRSGRGRSAAPASIARTDRVGEVLRRFSLERRVVEGQRTLVTGAAGREIAAREEPAGPGRQRLLDLVARGASLDDRTGDVGRWRRQLRPAIDGLPRRIAGVGFVDDGPDVVREPAGDAFLCREPANRRARIAERRPVLVVPGNVERLAIALEPERAPAFARDDAEALRCVESVDAVERGELETSLAGVGVERERSGADDRVIGYHFRGFEVALDAGVLHELHVPEVGEALTANRIARRIDADGDIDAGQVVNGVARTRRSSGGGPSRVLDRRRARSRRP